MADITIHRCNLRIVRRGGWSWGPEPRGLLQIAVKMLPELLARELAGLWPDDEEVEISAPLRITIPVSMSELLAAATLSDSDEAVPIPAVRDGLRTRIAQALRAAVEREALEPAASFESEKQTGRQADEIDVTNSPALWPYGAVLQALMSWQTSGVLEMRLAAFSQAALESWHRRALGGTARRVDLDPASLEMLDQTVDEIAVRTGLAPHNRQYRLQLRLLALVAAMAKLQLPPNAEALREAVNRALPVDAEIAEVMDAAPLTNAAEMPVRQSDHEAQSSVAAKPVPAPPLPAQTSAARLRVKPPADCHITSALPFLLLGPLSRLGYLKTLGATMEAAECLPEMPLFATALAYKVLAPAARGWRREQAAVETASAFAALAAPVTAPELAAFARYVTPYLSPLDAVLSGALIAGHDANQPLLLYRTETAAGRGFLLLDAEGLFPIAWAAQLSGLRQTLIHLDASAVLIPQATAETETFRWMDDEGFRFITDAMPTRGEQWRFLRRQSHERWWTNDSMSEQSALLRMARSMTGAVEDCETLWQALAIKRPSLPLADADIFECHITLAASVALAAISWALWREREQTAPHLALDRFGDMDAHVHYAHDNVRVTLPLGKRSQDLRDHGLLDRVTDVPWLDGRVLSFST